MAPTKQKNKRNVSLEIFKTSVCFLSMTVKLGVANKIDLKNLRGVPISWNVKSLNFGMFAYPTLLISQFTHCISIGLG